MSSPRTRTQYRYQTWRTWIKIYQVSSSFAPIHWDGRLSGFLEVQTEVIVRKSGLWLSGCRSWLYFLQLFLGWWASGHMDTISIEGSGCFSCAPIFWWP